MKSYDLLSEPIRRYIRDKRWEKLRSIQDAAISRILSTDENYILASRTASGKTEAAFLPILSKVNFNESGVQVLYISPLIALINDQFYRIEDLCKYLDVDVVKWHGEANKSLKDQLLREPRGIVLITPESLEAMFVNKPFNIKALFSNLKYVVIDEIHSFIGTDRGIQLKSILSRLQNVNINKFNIVGLSATIGDYDQAKKFTGDALNTKVLLDNTAKAVNAVFRYFESDGSELPLVLLKDLYVETRNSKVLIFPNSRGRAEEIAVKLKKISERVNGHSNYFSHHSSVNKEVREYIEHFAKNNNRDNFCISCTSTLELGIDIGTVDEVVQIDAAHSIASLIQRVGRSGRRDGEDSNLFLYATNPWSLLQALACWLLYKKKFVEPPVAVEKPYDILLHQALSIVKGHSGIELNELVKQLKTNFAFSQMEVSEIVEILDHLIEIDFLEKLRLEIIIGVEGEKIVNDREFYSMFKSEENFKVIHAGNTVGEIPISPQITENENIFLAAKIWKIRSIDSKSKKIDVYPAIDGKKPMFFGGGGAVDEKIREMMLDILMCSVDYDFLDQPSSDVLNNLRKDFECFEIEDLQYDRPLLVTPNKFILYTFAGTRINRTIQLLLKIAGIVHFWDDNESKFEIFSTADFLEKFSSLALPLNDIEFHISEFLLLDPSLIGFSKWGEYLPERLKIQLIKTNCFDIDSTKSLLEKMCLVENK